MRTKTHRASARASAPGLDNPQLYRQFLETLNERQRRQSVARESLCLGRGAVKRMIRLSGLSAQTLWRGRLEMGSEESLDLTGRVRRPGAGRKRIEVQQPGIDKDLAKLVEPETAGDPCSAKKWVRSSLARLVEQLSAKGYRVGRDTVRRLLKKVASDCVVASNASPVRPIRIAIDNSDILSAKKRPSRRPVTRS